MKKHLLTLFAFLIFNIVLSQKKYDKIVFKNVSIITMKDNKVLKNMDLFISNGVITNIVDTGNPYKDVKIIDCKGKFIMPSLSDAHSHLPKEEKELEKFLILNLINGVTKIRSMRGSWKHLSWKEKFNTNSFYPRMYISPPTIYKNYTFTKDKLNDYVENAKKFDFIKILSIKDENTFMALNKACEEKNVSLGGHFPHNISDSILFNSNYKSFEHLGGLTDDKRIESRIKNIKEKDIYICPTLSWYDVGSGRYTYKQLKNRAGMEYIPNETMEDWLKKTKSYRNKLGKEKYKKEVKTEVSKLKHKYKVINRLHKSGIKMILSPDSSAKYMITGFGILDEMMLLKNTDLNNFEILKMTTSNFSDLFNGNYGVIEKGKNADFLILDKNPLKNLKNLKHLNGIFYNNYLINKTDLDRLSKSIMPKN